MTPAYIRSKVLQVVLLIVLVFASAAGIAAQPPEPVENRVFQEVYLARDDGAGNPGDAATEFVSTDIPIHCVVVLGKATPVTVKMNLIAVSVAGVKQPEKQVISTSFRTDGEQDRVYFNGKPYKLWIPGTYRADIYIDGNLVGKFPFVIKGAAVAPKPAMKFQPKPRSTTAKRT